MTAYCDGCGNAVYPTPFGALEPEPHPLGVLGTDGEPLTLAEVLRGRREGAPAGRRRHVCPPPGQGELFAIPGATRKTRSRQR